VVREIVSPGDTPEHFSHDFGIARWGSSIQKLLERRLDVFFFARLETILCNQTRTRVPTQQCVVIPGRTHCFRFLKPIHRLSQTIVGMVS
jgi:hypothetical protein